VIFEPHFDIEKEHEHSGMLDWLSLKINLMHLSEPVVRHLQSLSGMVFKINALTGEEDWRTYCWTKIPSDSTDIHFRVTDSLHIQGSPARIGMPNNVFGAIDIRYCAQKMIGFAAQQLGYPLPVIESWGCTRIDVTRNYLMQSESEARQALAYLKQAPESRQAHSYEQNGFYIGKGSSLQKGKIYLKGREAVANQRKKRRAHYTEEQLSKCQRLLRAEHTIGRHLLRRLREQQAIEWYQLSPNYLIQMHNLYFKEYFSDMELTDMSTILEKLTTVSPTEGQARAAYDCYVRIRMVGYEQARVTFTKPSWYRHIKHLKAIGLTRADLQPINVIPLRKRAIELSQPIRHWDDIRAA
tara:strand:- start:822 stop:1883 length:1062 start_codon:yes stop_codon:yes gene_type:complete